MSFGSSNPVSNIAGYDGRPRVLILGTLARAGLDSQLVVAKAHLVSWPASLRAEQRGERVAADRPAEQEPLNLIALHLLEQPKLFGRLDAFCNDGHAQVVPHMDDRGGEG